MNEHVNKTNCYDFSKTFGTFRPGNNNFFKCPDFSRFAMTVRTLINVQTYNIIFRLFYSPIQNMTRQVPTPDWNKYKSFSQNSCHVNAWNTNTIDFLRTFTERLWTLWIKKLRSIKARLNWITKKYERAKRHNHDKWNPYVQTSVLIRMACERRENRERIELSQRVTQWAFSQ